MSETKNQEVTRREFLKRLGVAVLGGALLPKSKERSSKEEGWQEIELPAVGSLEEYKGKLLSREREITPPRETGEWQDYRFLVYTHSDFPENAHGFYGIKSLSVGRTQNEIIMGWRNGIGIGFLDKTGNLRTIQEITTSLGDYITQIASNPESLYFGGPNGYFWFNEKKELLVVPDSSDLTGRLRRVDYFSGYGAGVAAARETELYYIEGQTVRKWLTPLRNHLGRRDEILALASGQTVEKKPICYGVVSVNEGDDYTRWQRHIYRFAFDKDPSVPLQIEDLGVIDFAVNERLSGVKFNDREKIIYGRSRADGCCDQIGFVFPEEKTYGRFKAVFEEQYPDLNDFALTNNGRLWAALSVFGVEVIFKPFSQERTGEAIPRALIANPYSQSIVALHSGRVFIGHSSLPGQFQDALLTWAEPIVEKRKKIALPLVSNLNNK